MIKEEFDALSDDEKLNLYYESLGQEIDEAVWSTAFINDLPDISFAVIESGGKKDDGGKTEPRSLRHLPHHGKISEHSATNVDEPHLKNAAARVNQLKNGSLISKAKSHLRAHYKAKGWEIPPNLESHEPEALKDVTFTRLHLIEDKVLAEETDGQYRRGRLLGTIANEINANRRRYRREIWEKQIPRLKELITRGRFVGLVDHPGLFMGGSAADIALKFEDIWFGDVTGPIETSNELWLETIIIPTSKGRDIGEILAAGVELGISSNGSGATKPVYKKDGEKDVWDFDDVQDDYVVESFDIVYRPSVDDARIYKFEHREDDPMDLEELRNRYPELVTEIERMALGPLEEETKKLEGELVGIRTSINEKVVEADKQTQALNEATTRIQSTDEQLAVTANAFQEAQGIVETQKAELEELRPLKARLDALNHLLEKVKGEPLAWKLVETLKDSATPEEVDQKFTEAKDSATALLFAEDYLGGKGGKTKYGFAPSDADDENEEYKRWAAREGGLR